MGDASKRPQAAREAKLGRLALEAGWINSSQLTDALAVQETSKPPRPLGSILIELGALTEEQLAQLLQRLGPGNTIPVSPSFPPFGKYELLREIGRGAMGVVYEAVDTELRRHVALKMLISPPRMDPMETKPEDERFIRESQLHKSLPPHEGIVPVLEAGAIDNRRYIAMELVDGAHLGAWAKTGSVTMRQRVALLRDVALAIHHAHQHGVLHRDLKPENILVDKTHRPRITDFGLAKMLRATTVQPLKTATGTSLGTPAYMSPEQIKGAKGIDARADLYSLGVMLYELLTGRRPFEGETAYEIMMKTVNQEAVPPSEITSIQINPVLYKNLEDICLIALSKDPADRYADAEAFAADLTRWLKGEELLLVRGRKWRLFRSKKTKIAVLGGVAAVLVAVAAVGLWPRSPSTSAAPEPSKAPMLGTLPLQPGCIAEAYAGTNFNALGMVKIDQRPAFDDLGQPLLPGSQAGWTSARWRGYLDVPSTGTWLFEIQAQEPARLLIDGKELYEGTEAAVRPAVMNAGPHAFVLEHGQASAHDTLTLAMRRADAGPGSASIRLGQGSFWHAPADFQALAPQSPSRSYLPPVAGAEEGETITVLEDSGHRPERQGFAYYAAFWKGTWSGSEHLWWGPDVKMGDKLRVRFASGETERGALVLGVARASDHGIFKVRVNGAVVAERLDLYSADLSTADVEFKDVPLKAGPNELEFEVVGSNPAAREWGPGSGVFKLGLDYVLVR